MLQTKFEAGGLGFLGALGGLAVFVATKGSAMLKANGKMYEA